MAMGDHVIGAATTIALLLAALLPAMAGRVLMEDNAGDFISTRCSHTKYPPLCRASLSSYASKVRSSPTQLAQAAVSVSLAHAMSAAADVSTAAGSVGLKPGETMVLNDCLMVMGDSVQQLQRTLDAVGGSSAIRVENAQTWASTALTDENMCADELAGVDLAGRREAVRAAVAKAARLCSNALALISDLQASP
ncbi:putative pectinesterase/pectinesterase inhibitor 60 [Platanthera zijinensis]|uniref:Pectinesterase/pectinesterase inhibitor 60 n=1 Tax=Platanthera zijinensis TaxID=2320716 RepID=A0AAP0C2L5_9ASPA